VEDVDYASPLEILLSADGARLYVLCQQSEEVRVLDAATYFYRNPELQTGDYSRLFSYDEEDDANAWAASYKGSSVKVHIDPCDPSRSVLRKEDL
jgi:DNA-binding beta-propeller fold protein YncE